MSERTEAFSAVYAASGLRAQTSLENFSEVIEGDGWKMIPVETDRVIGGFMVRGHEVHFGVLPETTTTLSAARAVYATAEELMRELGWLETRVFRGDEFRLKFCKFWGFMEVAQDEHFIHMKCEVLKCHKQSRS